MRSYASETPTMEGQRVELYGWVHARRDMGKLIFIDLRDSTGVVQIVFRNENKELWRQADSLRTEWVVKVQGRVQKRRDETINPKIKSGTVEVLAESIEILNEAKTPPFPIDQDTKEVREEVRMKYRYLDLRTERMKKNLELRHHILKFIRDYLSKLNFLEIETPFLTKGTPEGAREFIIPSRLHLGKFYVLPQSPQQFKQLLMVASFENYFQIVRCFRDEDLRGDRQPEFTQLDLEMSFVQEEEIRAVIEKMLVKMIEELFPKKKIAETPFPVIDYKEVMEKYKTDKPDLRQDKNNPDKLAFAWIVNFPLFEYSEIEGKLVPVHHPFTAPLQEDIDKLDSDTKSVRARAYDLVLNGNEIGGGSIRIHKRDLQNKIFKILGLKNDEIERRFGHMLKAFEYGAPPHGGIALGLDRLVMILANEPSIREVIAFPKTGDARDLMMDAPTELPEKQLKEVHIQVLK